MAATTSAITSQPSAVWQNQDSAPFSIGYLVGAIVGGLMIIGGLIWLILHLKARSQLKDLEALTTQPGGPKPTKKQLKLLQSQISTSEKAYRKALKAHGGDPTKLAQHFGQAQAPPLQGQTHAQRFEGAPAYSKDDFQPVSVPDPDAYWQRLSQPGFGESFAGPPMREVLPLRHSGASQMQMPMQGQQQGRGLEYHGERVQRPGRAHHGHHHRTVR